MKYIWLIILVLVIISFLGYSGYRLWLSIRDMIAYYNEPKRQPSMFDFIVAVFDDFKTCNDFLFGAWVFIIVAIIFVVFVVSLGIYLSEKMG